jgi:hypothetical protein
VALSPAVRPGAVGMQTPRRPPAAKVRRGSFACAPGAEAPLRLSYLRGALMFGAAGGPLTMSNCLSQLSLSLPRACLHVNAQRDRSRDKLRDKLSTGR